MMLIRTFLSWCISVTKYQFTRPGKCKAVTKHIFKPVSKANSKCVNTKRDVTPSTFRYILASTQWELGPADNGTNIYDVIGYVPEKDNCVSGFGGRLKIRSGGIG
jgi:hypothetical protein